MTNIQRINSGARLSEAVIYGGKVYLCGFVAESGTTVAEQTADILAQIDSTLAEAGTDKTRLLKVNIWLTDISTIGEMNAVWDKWAVAGKTPARATVEARLADPSWKIEIMVEAAV
jgi:enamine deaminase RidA (YjgF/YER057c/UK114 family)